MMNLTATARRKYAKRHIITKSNDIDYLKRMAGIVNSDRYIVEIYDGRWNLVWSK